MDPFDADADADAKGGEETGGEDAAGRGAGFLGRFLVACGEKEEDGGAEDAEEGSSDEDDSGYSINEVTLTEESTSGRMEGLLLAKKLVLVLDLDHTLLNSTPLRYLSRTEKDKGFAKITKDDPSRGLYRLDSNTRMLTKLRPFVGRFLEEASTMFEMHVYTLAKRNYARKVVKLLDPDDVYFADRIVSSDESTDRNKKCLDDIGPGRPAEENAAVVVILDDTENVWEGHKDNLIVMERYLYFASSCRKFGYNQLSSLAERKTDESEHNGALAVMLRVLRSIHEGFFDSVAGGAFSDVREVIRFTRHEVLRGCTLAFSQVIPLGSRSRPRLPVPGVHPMWRLAEQLGATCVTDVCPAVTHVVAMDRCTEKALWAQRHGKFLVSTNWISYSQLRWSKADERDFPAPGCR